MNLRILLLAGLALRAFAADWKPVDPAELAEKKSIVEPSAAEVLLWEVRIVDDHTVNETHRITDHYVRVKIFSIGPGRGAAATSVRIPAPKGVKISEIAARTTLPDGKVVDLTNDAIFDSTCSGVNAYGETCVNGPAKVFALPGVVAGSVIEYRWRQTLQSAPGYERVLFQREDLPVRTVRYLIKPALAIGSFAVYNYACNPTPLEKDPHGYYTATISNLKVFHREPYMPLIDEVRPWVLLYYTQNPDKPIDTFWKEHGVRLYNDTHARMIPNKEIRDVAASVTKGATKPEEKLDRLYEYCRTHIRDIPFGLAGDEDRAKRKKDAVAADTIKSGFGFPRDRLYVFGALAIAAGFDARYLQLSDRNSPFDIHVPLLIYMPGAAIAVRLNDHWVSYDPEMPELPPGMLRQNHQGVTGMIGDPKDPTFVKTPYSKPDKSTMHTTGAFRLSPEGDLEGDVTTEFTGLEATRRGGGAAGGATVISATANEREDALKRNITSHLKNADVTNIRIENPPEPGKPLIYAYHLRVPGYATATPKRLEFVPAVNQAGIGARFPAKDRQYDICFGSTWTETDDITIELPAGYSLDNPDMPPAIAIDSGGYEVKAGVQGGNKLIYHRRFVLPDTIMRVPVKDYARLKAAFDSVHEADMHAVVLKQGSGTK